MAHSIDTEVLICGGGPCGLMAAIELGRRGIACLLVDRKPSTAFNPQANATQARTMELFRRLGLARDIRQLGLPPDHPTDIAYLTQFAGRELARLRLPTAAAATQVIRTLSGSWSAAELPHRVSQKFVEARMRQEVERIPTVDMRYDWTMGRFEQSSQGVTATVQANSGGDPVAVRARYLLAADGARSPVRHALGIEWEGATGIKRDFMGGRMLSVYLRAPEFYRLNPNDRAWMYVTVHPRLRAFIMSVNGVDEFAFHVQLPEGVDGDEFSEADARRFFAQASGLDTPIEILSMAPWLAGHALVVSRMQEGRIFLGGDAAHLFTPTGGLGYNTAVEDAVNLSWKLAAVLRGGAPEGLLDTYAIERKRLAVRNTGHARRLADSIGLFTAVPELDDDTPAGAAARAVASEYLNGHVRREFNIPGITFGGRYDGSPLIVGDGTTPPADEPNAYVPSACPGGRPPHAWLEDGRSLFDTFHRDWTLLVLGPQAPAHAEFIAAAGRLGMELGIVVLDNEKLRGLYEAPLALIRPDMIVAWRGHSDADAMNVLGTAGGYRPGGTAARN